MSVINKLFLTLSFLLVVSNFCYGQDTNEGSFKLTFKEYKVDSCLFEILEAIAETDSAHIRFPAEIYFYNLSFSNYSHYREMTIRPTRWYKHLPHDTGGVVVAGGVKFILMGRLDNDSLFRRTNNKVEVSVAYPVPQIFDTLDNKTKWRGWENSPTALVGSIKFCSGLPIDLRVDVDKKIERLNLSDK